ncbi:MAG TPA: hypothetical protein VFN53_06360 [Acidobacteriaceae bacterium]|nr:hypothetical protein [Acidobacteriaceae bacterium]
MAFKSFLDKIGHDFEVGLNDVLHVAVAAEPFVALADPAIGPVYASVTNLITGVVAQTEQKFTAMGKQSGTGAQKLAEAVQIVTPAATQILQAAGAKVEPQTVANWTNAVVALMNAYPAIEAAAKATTPVA